MNEHELLKTYRQYRGMTQKEVAEKLKMTHSGYSKYERGERKIDIELWMKLMNILHIPSSAFGNSPEFIEEEYWLNFEQRFIELAEDIKSKKGKMLPSELDRAANIFKNEFENIQNEKKTLLNIIKLDHFDDLIVQLGIEFLFIK